MVRRPSAEGTTNGWLFLGLLVRLEGRATALPSFCEEILDFEGVLFQNPFVLSPSKDGHKSYSEIKVLIFSMVRQVRSGSIVILDIG